MHWVRSAALLALVGVLIGPSAAAAQDLPQCFGEPATIVDNGPGDGDPRPRYVLGTPGNDVIVGTPRADVIDSNGGIDRICGEGGADQITLRQARPDNPLRAAKVSGGPGDDRIECGNAGNSGTGGTGTLCQGDAGDDYLHTGFGAGVIQEGGDGRDTLVLESAHDSTVRGGRGRDTIRVGGDRTTIEGGEGDDDIEAVAYGIFPFLNILGGAGDDDLVVKAPPCSAGATCSVSGPIRVLGEQGNDRLVGPDVVLNTPASQTYDIVLDGGVGDDRITAGTSTLAGSSNGAYRLIGGPDDDRLEAAAGPHQLLGGEGDDRLSAGRGDDLIDGGADRDRCEGGGGNDSLVNCER